MFYPRPVVQLCLEEWRKEMSQTDSSNEIRLSHWKDKKSLAEDIVFIAEHLEVASKHTEFLEETAEKIDLRISFQKA